MDQALVLEMLRALGVNYPADFRAIEQMPFEQGVQALEALKEQARKNYRKLAFELHPDRTGEDPVKTSKFKVLAQVREKIEKMTLRRAPPPPQPMPQIVIMRIPVYRHPFSTMNVTSTTASASTTSYGPGGPFFVATMRPT